MANNLRLIYENLADSSTLTASSTAIDELNLLQNEKANVWRSKTGVTTATIDCMWPSAQNLSCVSIPSGNFTEAATARLRYTQEDSVAQLVPYSEHLTATGWTTTNVTVTANGAISPDGISGAARVVGNGVSGAHTVSRSITVVLDQQYTISLFAKAGTNSWLYLDFSGSGGGYSTFNIGTGQLGSTVTGGVTARSITPVSGAPGWYRISITAIPTVATTTRTLTFSTQNVDSGSSTSTTGDAYYWGVNCTPGALTSYYPSDVTFTSRASLATYINSNGLVSGVSSGTARTDHYQYPSLNTVGPRLLLEGAAFNAALYSELISNAVYTKSGTTVGAASTSPDGATTALSLLDTSANSTHYIQQVIALNTATVYTLSTWVKAGSCTRVQLQNGSLGAFSRFNLTTGTSVSSGGTGYVNNSVVLYPNGWYRISLTFLTNASSSQSMVLFMENSSGITTYAGGSGTIYNWGWQLEVGYFPTSYIPSTSTAPNRAADTFTSTASTRPVGYMDWWQSYAYDSGNVAFNTAAAIKIPGLTATQSLSAYSYGGGRTLTMYSPDQSTTRMHLTISDPTNPQGYLEATRLVIGDYFSPTYDSELGATVIMEDASKSVRSDSGSLRKDIGYKFKRISSDLSVITDANRTELWKIVSYAGTSSPVWMSLYPANANPDKEQAYTIYGYFTKATEISARSYNIYATKFEVEGC